MENKRPELALKETSVFVAITELHNYFRDLQSYYKIAEGELFDELESVNNTEEAEVIKAKLKEVRLKVDYFHVINNAISIADTVIHTEAMIDEFHQK